MRYPLGLCLLLVSVALVCSECAAEKGFDIHRYIRKKYSSCGKPVFCNNLVKVDCGAAVDGPLYYLDAKSGEEISACGGTCWLASGPQLEVCETLCPPKEWTCHEK